MDKHEFLMRRWNERNLIENAIRPRHDRVQTKAAWEKTFLRILVSLIAFPILGAVGGFLIWTFIKLISGLSGTPGMN